MGLNVNEVRCPFMVEIIRIEMVEKGKLRALTQTERGPRQGIPEKGKFHKSAMESGIMEQMY